MTILKALLASMAIASMFKTVLCTNYTVGAPQGSWDLSTDYKTWVSDKTFHPGDDLIFTYTSIHTVWEVSMDDYNTCSKSSPLKQYSGGNTVIKLTEAGSRYFFCSTSTHCSNGQKVEILVVASDSSSPPSMSPPPPSSSSSPPPPPSKSAAPMGNEMIAIAFGAILMMIGI